MNCFVWFAFFLMIFLHTSEAVHLFCRHFYDKKLEIDPHMCTHLILTRVRYSAKIGGSFSYLPSDVQLKGFKFQVENFKKNNPQLKTSIQFLVDLSMNVDSWRRIADYFVQYALDYGFDGVHLTLEKIQEENFREFILQIRRKTKENRLLLTSEYVVLCNSFEVPSYFDVFDYVMINCHLYTYNDWIEFHNLKDTREAINKWTSSGIPKRRLLLIVMLSSYKYQLNYADCHSYGAGAKFVNHIKYINICRNITNYSEGWEDEYKISYKYQGLNWYSMKDERSLATDIDFIFNQGLGGAVISLWTDDIKNECGYGKYPLTKFFKRNLDMCRLIPNLATTTYKLDLPCNL